MKSLKYKMLVKFCVAVIIAIGIIEAIVSWKLGEAIPEQAGIVANDLTSQTKRVVAGHAQILKSTFEDLKGSVRWLAREISKHPAMAKSIERQHLAYLKDRLAELCERLGIDFVLVYDVEGKLQTAFPGNAGRHWAEEYYKSLGIGTGKKAFAKDEAGEEATGFANILKYGSDSMKALGLEAHDISGRGGIGVTSLGVVRDDFGDPLGVCIAGKLLNHYSKPLQQLYDATGSACVLFLDTAPIAQGGLDTDGSDRIDTSALQLDPEARAQVYGSDRPSDAIITLAGRRYISGCFAIEDPAGERIGAACAGIPEQVVLEARQTVLSHGFAMKRNLRDWLLGVGAASAAIFILLSLIIARGITQPINRVIKGLSEGSRQVASACNCVSSASQRLAECASEQAQSIRETSSSLDSMASTTAVNADNADRTNRLMMEANQIIARASESMHHLSCSMGEISTASENAQKIVRTIDDVAFQTNLLALNAAVEAARAGDCGAGFAVVADEVRNLALRTAEAARITSSLIEETVKKVKEGAALVERTSGEFLDVAGMVTRSGELVEKIAAASREQACGVQQVNKVVSEMDEATQQNAAIAEESASASEEMNAQAEQMKKFVAGLIGLVDGGAGNRREAEAETIEDVQYHPIIPFASSKGVNARGKRNAGNDHRTAGIHREWAEQDRASKAASRLTIAEP